ncbi:ABC transporter ATP-binding protein [Streptococcus suis]|nr:ABC transporter ATP-binding protein [Streptococcus suis]
MLRYFFNHKLKFFMFLLTSLLGGISVILMAYVLQQLVEVITSGEMQRLPYTSILALLYILVDSYMDYAVEIVNEKLTQSIMSDIRNDVSKKILNSSLRNIETQDDNELFNLYFNDLDVIEDDYIKELLSVYNDICVFVIALVTSLTLQPIFSLIMIALSILPIILPLFTKKSLQKTKINFSKSNEHYVQVVNDLVKGAFALKIFNGYKGVHKKERELSQSLVDSKVQLTHVNRSVYAVSYGLRELVNIGSWIVGGYFVLQGRLSFSIFFAVKQMVNYVAYPIQGMSSSYTTLVSASAIVKKVMGFLQESTDEENVSEIQEGVGKIVLKDVSIKKDHKTILKDVTLQFEKGKKYIVIGDSGSGKSTLLKTLLGVHDLSQGTVQYFNDAELEITNNTFLSNVTFIGQNTYLFNDDFKNNVTVFHEAENSYIEGLVKSVGLEEWLAKNNLSQTNLSQSLSGGEQKRLEVARALYRDSDVLLLDEVSSGLDKTRRNQIENLLLAQNDKILVYVTHIFDESLLNHFDYVIRVEDTKISQEII